MLTEEEKKLIHEVTEHYPQKSAASIEALKIVQNNKRWISDESIKDVAEALDMTAADLDSVATFYSRIYRKPVGEHVILLCDSVSCWIMGYENILKHISGKLGIGYGETTPDGRFTLLPNSCLGNCDKAPCMIIDNKTYDNLTNDKVDEILNEYINRKS